MTQEHEDGVYLSLMWETIVLSVNYLSLVSPSCN